MHLLDDMRDTNNIYKPFQLKTSGSFDKQPQTPPSFLPEPNRTIHHTVELQASLKSSENKSRF